MSHVLPPPPVVDTGRDAAWDVFLGRTRVVFGSGCLEQVGVRAQELGARRVLLVTDSGIRQAGHVDRAEAALAEQGILFFTFDGLQGNPSTRDVEAGTAVARRNSIDLIVGLGGGSSMDCAKGINFLLSNGGKMEDYWGTGKATRPMLPSMGIPTTAGTGSEAQSYALITQEGTRAKMACGDEKARFHTVLLDPDLTISMPRAIAAVTGLDAIGHAVESYVCNRANPLSRLYAGEAWRRLEAQLETALADPSNGEARGAMLWGAHLAGCAIESSMLGAAHACSNPMTAHHGVEHGVAVALMLPHVVRFNALVAGDLYAELFGRGDAEALARRIEALRAAARIPARLRDAGVRREALPALAAEAAKQWTAGFNPRPVGVQECEELYASAW